MCLTGTCIKNKYDVQKFYSFLKSGLKDFIFHVYFKTVFKQNVRNFVTKSGKLSMVGRFIAWEFVRTAKTLLYWWFKWLIPTRIYKHVIIDIESLLENDDVIKWKHLRRYWHFVLGTSPVTCEFPSQKASDAELWFFSLICTWTNGWVNSRDAGDLRRHRAHYDVTVMRYCDLLCRPT